MKAKNSINIKQPNKNLKYKIAYSYNTNTLEFLLKLYHI